MKAAVAKFESIFVFVNCGQSRKFCQGSSPNRDSSHAPAECRQALSLEQTCSLQWQEHRHKWVCTLRRMMAWNGFTQFRIGPSGSLLKTQQRAIRLSKGRHNLKLKNQQFQENSLPQSYRKIKN